MSSRGHSYTKRIHSTAYYIELCLCLRFQLDSFVGDKDFKKIKSELFSKISSQEQIKLRSLHRMFNSYLKNGTTKKLSGRFSPYLEFDEEIFELLNFVDLKGLALKKHIKPIAFKIIKKSVPSFKCSDEYLRRFIDRFELRKRWEELSKQISEMEDETTTFQNNQPQPHNQPQMSLEEDQVDDLLERNIQPQMPLEEYQVDDVLERNHLMDFFSETPNETNQLLQRYDEEVPINNNSSINDFIEEDDSLFYNTMDNHESSIEPLIWFDSEEEKKDY